MTSQDQLTVLNDSLRGQIANVPVPSPASSFIFQFDPAVGAFTRVTESLGPTFAQRAETIGRNRVSFGVSYSRFTFDTLDGRDLEDGELEVTFTHSDVPGGNFAFERDVIKGRIFAEITSDVFVPSVTYGILDNVDLSLAIPIIHNEIRLRGVATIQPDPSNPNPNTHQFPNGSNTLAARASGEATGVGDILLRGKYNFYRGPALGLATGVDLRLPSGSEDDLMGTGATRWSPFFIASGNIARVFSPHVNVGFTFGGGDKTDDEFFYAIGFDWAVIRPVTLNLDILGRQVLDNTRIEAGQGAGGRKIADSTLVDAAVGLKVNPWRNVVVHMNVLVPLNDTGLRDNWTPVVGLEIGF